MRKINLLYLILCSCLLVLFACATMTARYTVPSEHPEKMSRNQICTECHETQAETIVYERYDHTVYFADNHGPVARVDGPVCNMCHQQSFCNDCHVLKTDLKPSIKNQTQNYRRMPHRGDYLSRHQIDGRIDPISCYRCHGNPKSSESCAQCHG